MSEGYIYICLSLILILIAYGLGKILKSKWWLVVLPYLAMAAAGVIYSLSVNNEECQNAMENSVCLGPAFRWLAGYALAIGSLITGLLSTLASFIGYKRSRKHR